MGPGIVSVSIRMRERQLPLRDIDRSGQISGHLQTGSAPA